MQQYPSQMKIPQRLSLSALVLVLFAGCEARREAQPDTSSRQSDTPTLLEESLEGYNKRMEWFVHAPYGMFIHFGLYSLLGGEWKGRQIDGYAEWIQAWAGIHREEYAKLVEDFNPTEFDADRIVRAAKDAGMQYLVITAKHHDGFCLWDSRYTEFDVAQSPFAGRDILSELKAACGKHGLKFGLYYSIIDWNHPAQEPDHLSRADRFRWKHPLMVDGCEQEYFDYQTNQILELIEKYDPAILWFDGEWADWWTVSEGIKLYNAIRTAGPEIIVNNRVSRREVFELDFVTQEQNHFGDAFPKHWEGCYTLNKSWGYKAHDHDWKDAQTIYNKLKDINEKGGNLLLNVGPDGRGVVQPEAYQILEETAALLKANPIAKHIPQIDAVPGIVENSSRIMWRAMLLIRFRDSQAFEFVVNNPELSNVLIYGDSISIDYTAAVRSQLSDVANVYRIHTDGGVSGSFIHKMKHMHATMRDPNLDQTWDFDWDVIQFNFGLHDLARRRTSHGGGSPEIGEAATTIEDYQANLEAGISYLRKLAPKAKLVFVTTTPAADDGSGLHAEDAPRYNAAAMQVLAKHPDILVNDLYSLTQPNLAEWRAKPGDAHYNKTGRAAQGVHVADFLRQVLGK